MRIVPAIDLLEGQCVRLEKGAYDTSHQVADDPIAVARSYRDAGAELVHVVDLNGARDGVRQNRSLVADIVRAAAPARVELGGGLRSMLDLEAADEDGVARFVIGSAAVKDPDFLRAALTRYGDRIVVGVDAKEGSVATEGWREDSAVSFLTFVTQMERLGVASLIFTDIATDGMLSGPGWDSLRALREAVGCEITASGGVSSLDDIRGLKRMGVEAVIIGKALYAGSINLKDALACAAESEGAV